MKQLWYRSELKQRAKTSFKKNYWSAVLVSLILALITASGGGGGGRASSSAAEYSSQISTYGGVFEGLESAVHTVKGIVLSPVSIVLGMMSASIILMVMILGFVFKLLVGNVLVVGARGFYIENLYSNPGVGRILDGFRSGYYSNIVKIMFLRDLYTFLWTLLLVIPGIVKSYEYRLVPYLLAEYPDMPSEEAFRRSKEMMYGQKWNAFVLDLSFIPWKILSGITFGIAGLFYVSPYVDATDAELYDVLSRDVNPGNTYSGSNY